MASTKQPAEKDLHTALRHPLRREILLLARGCEKLSPKEAAERLDEPLSTLSYHFRVLCECDAVELVDTRPVRGSMEHFYAFSVEESWALASLDATTTSRRSEDGSEAKAAG